MHLQEELPPSPSHLWYKMFNYILKSAKKMYLSDEDFNSEHFLFSWKLWWSHFLKVNYQFSVEQGSILWEIVDSPLRDGFINIFKRMRNTQHWIFFQNRIFFFFLSFVLAGWGGGAEEGFNSLMRFTWVSDSAELYSFKLYSSWVLHYVFFITSDDTVSFK